MTKFYTYTSTKSDGTMVDLENKKNIAKKLGIDVKQIFCPDQHHQDDIFEPGMYEPEYGDASVTNKKGVVLRVLSADCLGITFMDKKNEVIGVSHCGRRGTEKKLAQKVIKKMLEYGAELSEITCLFGPSIAQENYEVTMDCGLGFFPEAKQQISQEKQLLDIPLENKMQLLELGILEKNIILSEIDTYTDENYFSHRKGDSGRFANFIWMTE